MTIETQEFFTIIRGILSFYLARGRGSNPIMSSTRRPQDKSRVRAASGYKSYLSSVIGASAIFLFPLCPPEEVNVAPMVVRRAQMQNEGHKTNKEKTWGKK
jgi:hypothetical protein